MKLQRTSSFTNKLLFATHTHSDSSQKSLRNVGYNNPYKEHNSLKVVVLQNGACSKQGNPPEDCHSTDDVNKV